MRPKSQASRHNIPPMSGEELFRMEDEDAVDAVPDDDCAVVDDADDELEENENDEDDEDDGDGQTEAVPSAEEVNAVFASRFEEDVRNEAEDSNGDSADDIWNDDKIPDPLSEEDEYLMEEGEDREDEEDPNVILALGKTFNDAFEFKSTKNHIETQ